MADEHTSDPQLPLDTAGVRLRTAREAKGLTLEQVADLTKIGERQLLAIEQDNFSALAGKTYAVGFSRSYARAVGLDDAEIANAVRAQLAEGGDAWPDPQPETFEPGDPARIPPSRLAWLAGLAAIIALVILAFVWPGFLSPAGSMPNLTSDAPAPAPRLAPRASEAAAPKPAPSSGPVVFTATEDAIWVKFYDAAGTQLFQKQMSQGESFTIPADANGPMIWTGRADALRITVGGREVARLATGPQTVKDVAVSAEALASRGPPAPVPAAAGAAAAGGENGAGPRLDLPQDFRPVSQR